MNPNLPGTYSSFSPAAADRFAFDKFLFNQKRLSLNAKYYVYAETERPLFYVDRPVLKIKAQITVYEDDTKARPVLVLTQDSAIQLINSTLTLTTPEGQALAQLKRQGLFSLLRRTWKVYDAAGQEICVAQEDSWWKAIARRATDIPFLRTNFEIVKPGGGARLGEFVRRWTIGDKYVMDLTPDMARTLDRRVALALAIVLDLYERR